MQTAREACRRSSAVKCTACRDSSHRCVLVSTVHPVAHSAGTPKRQCCALTHAHANTKRPISIHTRRVDGLSTASRSTKISAPKKEPSKAIKGGLDPRPRVGVNEGVTHFGFGRLLVGFGSSNSAASDTPSTSGGGASPASAATVGYLGRFASQHCKSSAETEQSGASSGTFFSAGERSFCPVYHYFPGKRRVVYLQIDRLDQQV